MWLSLFTCKLAVGQAIDRTAGCRSREGSPSRTGYEVTAVFEEKISGRKANIERPVFKPLPGILHRSAEPGGYAVADRDLTPGAFHLEILKALDITRIKYACISKLEPGKTLRPDKTVNPLVLSDYYLLGNWPQSNGPGDH